MARRAGLFHLDQQRVAVAIEGEVLDHLDMAAGFALHPEFLARAAPEMRPAGGDGGFERGAVHPGHHQHAAGGLFLDDGRDEAVHVKFQLVVKTHGDTLSEAGAVGEGAVLSGLAGRNTNATAARMHAKAATWFQRIFSPRYSTAKTQKTQSVMTSWMTLSGRRNKPNCPSGSPGPGAGIQRTRCPRLTRITIPSGLALNFKWPYHAKVMKTFEQVSRTMGSQRDWRRGFILWVGEFCVRHATGCSQCQKITDYKFFLPV